MVLYNVKAIRVSQTINSMQVNSKRNYQWTSKRGRTQKGANDDHEHDHDHEDEGDLPTTELDIFSPNKLAGLRQMMSGGVGLDLAELLNKGNDKVFAKDNKIYFMTEVNESSVNRLIKLIEDKNAEMRLIKTHPLVKNIEPKPIFLHITSDGGCLLSGLRAIDYIKNSQIPIYTVVDGRAGSAAALMAVVGKKRFMSSTSYFLIHQLTSSAWGNFREIEDEYYNLKLFMAETTRILKEHSTMSEKMIKDQLRHDIWWKVDVCMEKGLIDGVYTAGMEHAVSEAGQAIGNQRDEVSEPAAKKRKHGRNTRSNPAAIA